MKAPNKLKVNSIWLIALSRIIENFRSVADIELKF